MICLPVPQQVCPAVRSVTKLLNKTKPSRPPVDPTYLPTRTRAYVCQCRVYPRVRQYVYVCVCVYVSAV